MEQRKQKTGIVLKYGKRRYDGGSEIEAIRAIERQQTISQLNRLQTEQRELEPTHLRALPAPAPEVLQPEAPEAPEATVAPITSTEADAARRKNRMFEAAILGPMEILVGLVGMMTAGLAIITFKRANNAELLKQSQGVFLDCLKTLTKGCKDVLTTPVRVIKAATHA